MRNHIARWHPELKEKTKKILQLLQTRQHLYLLTFTQVKELNQSFCFDQTVFYTSMRSLTSAQNVDHFATSVGSELDRRWCYKINLLFSLTGGSRIFPRSPGTSGPDLNAKTDAQRIILVMFLGGCTFSEISALRFFGREKGKPARPIKILL